jgi:hypothetical protein
MKRAGEKRRWVSAAALLAVFLLGVSGPVTELEGVKFPRWQSWRGVDLQLQGVGLLRYRIVFKGYVAGLYLGSDVDTDAALDDVPRRLEIEYFWDIPANLFTRATVEGIARNADPETVERLRGSIAQLNALYQDVAAGDRYSITYVPGEGTELALNGRPLGVVEGAEFSSALFAIWLGDQPLDATLRERLLAAR